jgi:NLR family CARD domain-containing protein 3
MTNEADSTKAKKEWRNELDLIEKNDSGCTKTKFFDYSLNTAEAIELVYALQKNTTVHTLCINDQWLNVEDNGYLALALYLKDTTMIKHVNVYGAAKMDYQKFCILSYGLNVNKSIKTIHISWFDMRATELKALFQTLECNKGLKTFILSEAIQLTEDNTVGCNEVGQVLDDVISRDKVLLCLSLKGNKMPYSLMVRLSNGLRNNLALKVLKLEVCTIDADGIRVLMETLLFFNKKITHLSLKHTLLYSAAAKWLAALIRSDDCRLKKLNLCRSELSDIGFCSIVVALESNQSITNINISGNIVSGVVAQAIARLIMQNKVLKILNLRDCSMGDSEVATLAQALHSNDTLEQLELSGNNVSDNLIKSISQDLKRNISLSRTVNTTSSKRTRGNRYCPCE